MTKYRSEVHLVTDDRTYVWTGKAFELPMHDNAKRYCFLKHAQKAAYELNRAQSFSKYPLMERGKYQAVAIDLDAKPEEAQPPKPEPTPSAAIARAAEITVGMDDQQIPDGTSYCPTNGTAGEIFHGHWCNRCEHDVDENCSIVMLGYAGEEPIEWQYQQGRPICTAWQQRTTPPKPEPVEDRATVPATMPRFVPAQDWSAAQAAADVTQAIAPVPTDYPFSTPEKVYRDRVYWIAGDSGNGRNGRYWYFVRLTDDDGEPVRTIQSEEEFSSTVAANQAARGAIEKLGAIRSIANAPTAARAELGRSSMCVPASPI